mgnify:CR=1 FL=1
MFENSSFPQLLVTPHPWKIKDAIIKYFKEPIKDKEFGNWSNVVDQFDPFRDGKAAYRIGTFKKWLLEGLNQRKNRDIIIKNAVDRYANIWGNDKVIAGK